MTAKVGYSTPMLHVSSVERSIQFYEHLGFEPAEQLANGPEGGSRQAFRMSLRDRLPLWADTAP